jgi:putative ABC transport system substrate-binding protein
MRRREFVALIGTVAATWPLAARAQSAMPVVGFMSARAPGESIDLVSAFYRGLREVGFIEGQNVIIAFRWAEGHLDRLPILAKELIDLRF